MKTLLLLATLFPLSALAGEMTVKVKGMVCSMCAQGIEKKFKEEGMEKVHVDMDEKEVHLVGKDLSDEDIKRIVSWAGYEAGDISRK